MNGLLRATLVTAVLAFGALVPAAGEPADDSHDARLAAALTMFDTCGEREQLNVFFAKSAQMITAQMKDNPPNLNEAQLRHFRAIVEADLKRGIDSYVALTMAKYADLFTVADIEAMTAFCRTPVGQKVSAMRSRMEAETFDDRQAWMRQAIMAAVADAQQKIQTEGNTL